MQISNATIFNKIQKEIEGAKVAQNPSEIASHMANIKLMTELWLDEYEASNPFMKQHEMVIATKQPSIENTKPEIDDDGMSIFDF